MYNMITCPSGLVFNPKTGICTWPDEAHKLGCSSQGICIIISYIKINVKMSLLLHDSNTICQNLTRLY